MPTTSPTQFGRKLGTALLGGLLVAATAIAIDLMLVPLTRESLIHQLTGDVIAGLVATLVYLALHLHNEEMHYRFAMERAAIVAELNHHVRNAVFPLCLAVQRGGDAEALRMSTEAMERINIAMKDAATDVFAMKINYAAPPENQDGH